MKNLSQLSAKELWSMARAARALRKVYNRKEVNLKGMISGLSNTNEIARAMFAREIGLTVACSSTTGICADLDSLDVCEWLLSAITKGRDETLQLLQLLAIDAEKEACRITNLERWHRVRQINVAEACREQGLDFTAEEIAAHTVDDGNLDGKISTVIKRMQATRDAIAAEQTADDFRREGLTETAEQFEREAEKKRGIAWGKISTLALAVVMTVFSHVTPAAANEDDSFQVEAFPKLACQNAPDFDVCAARVAQAMSWATQVGSMAGQCDDMAITGSHMNVEMVQKCNQAQAAREMIQDQFHRMGKQ